MNHQTIKGSSSWFLMTSPAFLITHAVPLAYAYKLYHNHCLPIYKISKNLAPQFQDLMKNQSIFQALMTRKTAVCLDIPSLIKAYSLGFRCIYLHHSLLGKNVMFHPNKTYWPFRLAHRLFFSDKKQFKNLTKELQKKSFVIGHLPYDWTILKENLLPAQELNTLKCWREKNSFKIIFIATRGSQISMEEIANTIASVFDKQLCIAIKGHPGQKLKALHPKIIDLGAIPIALLVNTANIVIGEHSSATIEAAKLGSKTAVIMSPLLQQLSKNKMFEADYKTLNIPILDDIPSVLSFIQKNLTYTSSISSGFSKNKLTGINIVKLIEHSLQRN